MKFKNLTIAFPVLFLYHTSFSQSQKNWKISTPEQQGMSSSVLVNALKDFKQDSTNIHSLVIVKNSHLVMDAAFYPFQNNYAHDLASVSKSVTSLLIGIAIDKKFIKNENEPIIRYFPEYPTTNDTLKQITIKDLLNMCSGWQCSWNDGEKELRQMVQTADWVKYMFDLPFDTIPGYKFSYCSGNFYLLSEILQRTTKMTAHEFAIKYLFQPLGFGRSYWEANDKGVNNGYGDVIISIYDMAKIGCVVLNKGNWNGKQLISRQWINKIKPLYKVHKTESYGYGWWLDSENPGEIQAMGRGGQRLFILTNEKMIIATAGGGFDAGDLDDIALESIQVLTKDKSHHQQLQQQIKIAAMPDMVRDDNSDERFFSAELNRTFQLSKNSLGLASIRFEKRGRDGYMILEFTDDPKEEHPVGLNGQYKISIEPAFGLPIAVKARWIDRDTLEIIYNRLCRIEKYKFMVTFKGNSIEMKVTEPTKRINETLTGKSEVD